ncbi:MAG: YbbR-like domain-containing protein [Candidatus Cloacimonetes bacterium]|nr:YbbR-like domain-containing protein [Candidatus Cloacimonadota bacterium]
MHSNLFLKILVVVIAALLWLQQALLKDHTAEIHVPLSFLNLPDELVLKDDNIRNLPVLMEGRGLDFILLKFSSITFIIDAADYKYGRNKLLISENDLNFPERIKLGVKKIDQDLIRYINCDRLVESSKPIELIYASAAEEEYFIRNKINDAQQKVSIKGPKSIVDDLGAIKTKKITQKMVKDGLLTIELVVPDNRIQLLQPTITFDVTSTRLVNQIISLIPIEYPLNLNITIIPQKVSVMLRGPEDLLNKLTSDSIRAYINPNDIKKALNTRNKFVEVNFVIPSGIKLLEHTPQNIQILEND